MSEKRVSKSCLTQGEKKTIKPVIFLPLALALVGFLVLLPTFLGDLTIWNTMLSWSMTTWSLFAIWLLSFLGMIWGFIVLAPYFKKECEN